MIMRNDKSKIEKEKLTFKILLEAMEMVNTDFSAYLNMETNKIVLISDEDFGLMESYDINDISDFPPWQQEQIKLTYDVVYKNYLQLPTSYDIHEHKIMQDFVYSLDDVNQNIFMSVLFKKKAFHQFKALLASKNLETKWYQFRQKAYEYI